MSFHLTRKDEGGGAAEKDVVFELLFLKRNKNQLMD